LDFELALEKNAAGFRAHVINSPAGEAEHTFAIPLTFQELSELYSQFGRTTAAPRAPRARLDLQSSSALQSSGKRLYDAVFAENVRVVWLASRGIAKNANASLRIVLHLSHAAELQDLPWELLHDEHGFLAHSQETPIVRYLEASLTPRQIALVPPLRALVVMASPPEYAALDLDQEWGKLENVLADVQARGMIHIERLKSPTLAELQTRLRQNAYHIFHFGGHGEFRASAQTASLILQNDDGSAHAITAAQLGAILSDHKSLRLVVLNACEGARASTRDAFGGIAQTLIAQGIPAVVAMQFAVSDTVAQILAREMYAAIADGYTVEQALSEARKAIRANQFAYEWLTPVLYTRALEGKLFDLTALSVAERNALRATALARLAERALAVENFARAVEYAQALTALDPANGARVLERAQLERDLAQLYAEGKKYFDAARWNDALDYLRRIQNRRLGYRDVDALVAIAEREAPKRAPAPKPIAKNDPLETHYAGVIKALIAGRLVPFLGVGANAVGRPHGAAWSHGQYVPDSQELAAYLAQNFSYQDDDTENLVHVSQYISTMTNAETLKGELHSVLDADYPPTRLHRFLATMSQTLRGKGYRVKCPIIVSTTYDDILERTFRAANEPFDLVTYIADGNARGKWRHRAPDGADVLIDIPNQYADLNPDERAVIIKIHGAVDRADTTRDSFVITEDHYIDYLTNSDIASLIPVKLKARLELSAFLFLGYSLRDWNLRVLLYRIWGNSSVNSASWAIQAAPQLIDQKTWQPRNVSIVDMTLENYLDALEARVRDYPRAGAAR